jgi:hypothetical protein
MGAVIACRLAKMVRAALNIENIPIYFWTDSKIVYFWIKGTTRKWKPFVSNRVEEIHNNSNPSEWHHCPGKDNPADLATRGITATELMRSEIWWNGASWLSENVKMWPNETTSKISDQALKNVNDELKVISVNVCNLDDKRPIFDTNMHSKLVRLLRVTAYVFRFIKIVCKKIQIKGCLSGNEMKEALAYWIQCEQQSYYSDEIKVIKSNPSAKLSQKSSLNGLNLYLKADILKVDARLRFSELPCEHQDKILLPAKSYLVYLIINDAHIRMLHAGIRDIVIEIRQLYWIPKLRQTVKKIIHECVICKRWTANSYQEIPTPLPKERCSISLTFQATGVDFAGPIYVYEKDKSFKSYICLFTCASTRAVHLEATKGLDCNSFLMAFKRFVSRRGFPEVIFSDNAKTFKKAAKDLTYIWNILNDENSLSYFAYHKVTWKFIVERAPWWGGFWERLVRTVKAPLKRTLRNAKLSMEEFQTVLCEVEAMVNSRPITTVYNDINDAEPLSPSHFLCGKRLTISPDIPFEFQKEEMTKSNMNRRLRHIESLQNQLWKQWNREYLSELNIYASKRRQNSVEKVKVGEVVLIDDDRPRQHWKMGIINEVYLSKDGRIRSALIKTSNTELRRPIQRLYPLEIMESDKFKSQKEINNDENCDDTIDVSSGGSVKKSSRGRILKIVDRFQC